MTSHATHEPAPPVLEHRASFKLPAAPERAFRALTDPGELERWFAEHAEVEPRAGGAYRFFGRATLGTPSAREATQRLSALDPGRGLAFRWRLHGVDTEVAYALHATSAEGESRLEIAHSVFGALPFPGAAHVLDDLWRLYAGNLIEHLGGGSNVVLPDFTSTAPEVRLSIEIAAPPSKVFRALLDPDLMNRWLGGAARVDRARGEYSYGWHYDVEGKRVAGGPTRILELVEDERLVTDWPDWRGDPSKPSTRVTWQLDALPPDGKRTRLTLVHAGFAAPVERGDYQQGWAEYTTALQALLEAAA